MKKYNTLFYLLFVLLIMGAFAAMAQNDYGLMILGSVAFVFSMVFFLHLISMLFEKKNDDSKSNVNDALEMIALGVLSGILAMRVFYIHFPYVEFVFGGAGVLLILVYLQKAVRTFALCKPRSTPMAFLVLVFHSSIILYLLSMISVAFLPVLSEPAGGLGFASLLAFVGVGLMSKEIMMGNEKISAFTFVSRFKDASVVLMMLFFLFTGFMGLTKIEVLPKMYSDEFPQVYFKMVTDAETGREEPIDGKYKHEEFKDMYDQFVQRHAEPDKK